MKAPAGIALLCAILAMVVVERSCTSSIQRASAEQQAAERTKSAAAAAAQRTAEEKERCLASRAALVTKHRQWMAAKDYVQAAVTITQCANTLGDSELLALASAARTQKHLQRANDRSLAPTERLAAMDALAHENTVEHDKQAPLRAAIARAAVVADAKEARDAVTAKRRAGVSIGMTKEDVLASSWGKPRTVNTTTSRHGRSEQWVYDGGYLYFENGVLTTIQN